MYPRYIDVTDGRTGRRTDGRTTYDSNTALALRASRGKNSYIIMTWAIPDLMGWVFQTTVVTVETGI